ncbi:DUF2171 domain-containing protein [Roseicella aerolata]|uniref:DUF2171 domain-containing protein n=1 Tax=Roseicella aerolata TaxID=2883479 RepID=A0A9X1ICQ1_9PROT|nr:DUF2171 domain-containing protein [Roseicella aerolata]MCB4821549.1 DUF2171 domain-containing protein [Roseicella aerolata]
MVNAERAGRGEIQHHMPVIGSDGRHVGTVDGIDGDYIRLTRSDADAGGRHRWIPQTLLAGLDGGQVRLSVPAAQAEEAVLDEDEVQRRVALDPNGPAEFGVPDEGAPHGSRAHAHGGPKGQREQGQSGSVTGNRSDQRGQTAAGADTNRR